jgi:hypothetical protein
LTTVNFISSYEFAILPTEKYRTHANFIHQVEIKSPLGTTVLHQPLQTTLQFTSIPADGIKLQIILHFAKRCTLSKMEVQHCVDKEVNEQTCTADTVLLDYNDNQPYPQTKLLFIMLMHSGFLIQRKKKVTRTMRTTMLKKKLLK